uniref:Uncharacterized protein n=1 Tax=Rhizobium leguminosarum bv. trifolii TaxID=386 RepID=A0A1C9I1L4_RHILT|nr:hypothetical protein [Rhizobium leguminosarum bv. trifolii]
MQFSKSFIITTKETSCIFCEILSIGVSIAGASARRITSDCTSVSVLFSFLARKLEPWPPRSSVLLCVERIPHHKHSVRRQGTRSSHGWYNCVLRAKSSENLATLLPDAGILFAGSRPVTSPDDAGVVAVACIVPLQHLVCNARVRALGARAPLDTCSRRAILPDLAFCDPGVAVPSFSEIMRRTCFLHRTLPGLRICPRQG